MKIIVIGATGTIGSDVVKAFTAHKHQVIGASRKGEVKVDLEDRASIENLFAKHKGIAAKHIKEKGSVTLTTGILATHRGSTRRWA